MHRRSLLSAAAAVATAGVAPGLARASVPARWDGKLAPPLNNADAFVQWAARNRGEDPEQLRRRWERYQAAVASKDILDDRNRTAFLMTPREHFVLRQNLARSYEHNFLDIGYGVTISGPHLVARMTQVIDVQPGDKILEIGTGSGYQSAYLAYLAQRIFTVEIIKPLAERTRGIYDALVERGYVEYGAISSRNSDGYHGWEEEAPFDKIIVTCGIDHIPPPLLRQLRNGGTMVIPVGPPGAQRVLKVVKEVGADGAVRATRSDIYGGRIVPFVPFTKLEVGVIKGTHNK